MATRTPLEALETSAAGAFTTYAGYEDMLRATARFIAW